MQDHCSPRAGSCAEPVAQKALGSAVRELRARRGLSQEALGEQADMHRNYVGAIERGEINPTFRVLMRVAGALGVPLSSLVRLFEQRRDEP